MVLGVCTQADAGSKAEGRRRPSSCYVPAPAKAASTFPYFPRTRRAGQCIRALDSSLTGQPRQGQLPAVLWGGAGRPAVHHTPVCGAQQRSLGGCAHPVVCCGAGEHNCRRHPRAIRGIPGWPRGGPDCNTVHWEAGGCGRHFPSWRHLGSVGGVIQRPCGRGPRPAIYGGKVRPGEQPGLYSSLHGMSERPPGSCPCPAVCRSQGRPTERRGWHSSSVSMLPRPPGDCPCTSVGGGQG